MLKNRCIILAILMIIIQSCASEQFTLNYNYRYSISGYIMNNLDGVEIVADNAIELFDGAIVSLRSLSLTQFSADFTMKLKSGKGLRFALRSTTNNYPKHPSITFDFTTEGYSISHNGNLVKQGNALKAQYNTPTKIIFENDGDLLKIKVDCEIVFWGKTKLPATEHIIIECLEDTYARLYGIDFTYILYADPLSRTAEELVPEPIYLE